MPKKAHTEEEIVAVLRQGEAGEKVADIWGGSDVTGTFEYNTQRPHSALGYRPPAPAACTQRVL